jgi:hypothetical protein
MTHGAEGLAVEQGEGSAHAGKIDAGAIGGAFDDMHPMPRGIGRLFRAIGEPAHRQRIGKTGDAEPDPPLRQRLLALLWQRVV